MPTKQLTTLLKFETDKAEKAEQALREAEMAYQQNLTRLQSVSDYRLEYMKRLSERSLQGISSATYSHFHAFIKKLDNASEQVEIAIKQAKALAEQKKQQWLAQRQKVQAVELLLDKKKQQLQIKANRQEQRMFDEIATQQFLRKQRSI
jgi:flagellar FliJ protein